MGARRPRRRRLRALAAFDPRNARMASLDRPKLRPVTVQRFDHAGQSFAVLEAPLGVVANPVLIPLDGFHWVVRHFDGRTSLTEIQARILQGTGQLVPVAELKRLVEQLEGAMI